MKNNDRNRRFIFEPRSSINQNDTTVHLTEKIVQWPLEAGAIQRAVLEYGKRTAFIGAIHALKTLERYHSMLLRVKSMSELDKIIYDLQADIKKIKLEFQATYDEE